MKKSRHSIMRYAPSQRLVHWLGATGFLLLLCSGVALVWPPLSFLAYGGTSRLIHQVGAVLFILWPILYAVLNPRGLLEVAKESFTYGRADWEWLKRMPGYFLGRAHQMPKQGRINAGQKLHHAATAIFAASVACSGLVLWFGKGQLGGDGLAVVAMVHDLSMLTLTVLFIGHVYFTFVYDALPSMLTGYVTEEYVRMEHAAWLEKLPQAAPHVVETGAPKAEQPTSQKSQ